MDILCLEVATTTLAITLATTLATTRATTQATIQGKNSKFSHHF